MYNNIRYLLSTIYYIDIFPLLYLYTCIQSFKGGGLPMLCVFCTDKSVLATKKIYYLTFVFSFTS